MYLTLIGSIVLKTWDVLINFLKISPSLGPYFESPLATFLRNLQIYYTEKSYLSRVGTIFVPLFIDKGEKRSRRYHSFLIIGNTSLLFLEEVVMIVHFHNRNLLPPRLFRPLSSPLSLSLGPWIWSPRV